MKTITNLLYFTLFLSFSSLAQPQWQWLKTGGGTHASNNYDITYAFAKDASNNIYSCGIFTGTNIQIGTGIYSSSSNSTRNAFVSKKDINGNPIWQYVPTSSMNAFAYNIAVDSNGDVVVCGQYSGTLTVGSTTLTAGSGTNSGFVFKLNGTTGSPIWAKSFKSAGNGLSDVASYGIDTYSDGSIYVCGSYSGTGLTFNDVTTYASTTNASGTLQTDGYIVKLNSSGSTLWVKRILGTNNSASNYEKLMYDVIVNASGNPVAVGYFKSNVITMYPGSQTATNASTTGGYFDAFVASWSASGSNIAVVKHGSVNASQNDYLFGIDLMPDNNYAVCGQFSTVAAIKKISSSNLSALGTFQPSGGANSFLYVVDTDASGNIYSTGTLTYACTFGTTVLDPNSNNQDNLLVKLNTSNTWDWAINYGTSSITNLNDIGRSLCVVGNNDLIVGGAFSDTLNLGNLSAISQGKGDFYEARYAPCTNSMAFVNQPSNLAQCPNSTGIFTVSTNESALYTWYKNGNIVSGVTSNSYSSTISTMDDGATVYCVATGACGTATSNSATISLPIAPTISTNPIATQTICLGNSATFSVVASGNSLLYQWLKNGNTISGATNSTYTINSTTLNDGANYTVRVSNSCGTNVVSNVSALTVLGAPTISNHPVSSTICVGSNLSLSVVSPDANVTYQWKKDNVNLNGQTTNSLTINNATLNEMGNYTVVVSNNSCGSTTSTIAYIGVVANTVIGSQPTGFTACEFTSNSLTINAAGGNLTYSWSKNGNLINGANSNILNFNSLSAADNGSYIAYVSGVCGNVISNSVNVLVNENTEITNLSTSFLGCEGSDLSLNPTVSGTNLTYQWLFNSTPISGANTSSYSIPSITALNSGDYTLSVIGTCGIAVSNIVDVTVNIPSSSSLTENSCGNFVLNGQTYTQSGIFTQTIPNYLGCDSVITLNLTVTNLDLSISNNGTNVSASDANATYQWIDCNLNTPIPNETQQTYTPTLSGNYAVIITKNGCSDTSNCEIVAVTAAGLKELTDSKIFMNIFPNPVSDVLTISCIKPSSISIINVVGAEVLNFELEKSYLLNVSNLTNGIYFVRDNETNQTIRFVKQ
jgi:hypothetical protein